MRVLARRLPAWAIGLLAVAPLIAAVLAGASPDIMLASPLLVLVVPLLLGRYPGEERLARLRGRLAAGRPRRPTAAAVSAPRDRRALVARGGRPIAASLAERGPPPALAGARV